MYCCGSVAAVMLGVAVLHVFTTYLGAPPSLLSVVAPLRTCCLSLCLYLYAAVVHSTGIAGFHDELGFSPFVVVSQIFNPRLSL